MIVCAEIGLQHCGCLGTAFAFVDAVADAGVDVAKFQCHANDPCDKFRPGMENYFVQDHDRREYWNRTAFRESQWRKLSDKCHNRGLKFACSVFSLQGVEMMSTIVDIWKVPSSKTNDWEMLTKLAISGKPVVLSTGMSDGEEVRDAWRILTKYGCEPIILQATSEYPCPPEHVGLFQPLWNPGATWGLSDHTGKIATGIAAAALDADMLEVHVCWSKQQWGPDVSSSLTIEELKQLVDGVKFVRSMRNSSITKDELAAQLSEVRSVFRP